MQLIIYTLSNCKVCKDRQNYHNEVCESLQEMGINTQGIMFGHVNGKTYLPMEAHDKVCRKANDSSKYAAPVYILEDDQNMVKLADFSAYKTPENYVEYIRHVISNMGDDE